MKHCISAVLLTALFVSCVDEKLVDVTLEDPKAEAVAEAEAGLYVPGEAYVYFTDEMAELIENDIESGLLRTKSAELNQTFDEIGIIEMHRVFPHAGKFEPRTREAGLHKWYVVKYSEDISRTKAAANFLSMEGVEYVEPARRIKINDFNDPKLGELWGLNNVVNPDYDINVKPVWENYTTGNPDVIVSVVDEGVDYKHEDLKDNCVEASLHYSAVPGSIVAGEHGTHVAGTIAAVNNNGIGVSGIAGGDKSKNQAGVKILSCQIFSGETGSTKEQSARAIKEGADRGAVISQNSWGYVFDVDEDGKLSPAELEVAKATPTDKLHADAIDYFIAKAGYDENGVQDGPMAGGVVIFAAGNDASQYGAPADYKNVIAVGSIDSKGRRSDFSNYGDWVDIAAPGTDIYSTIPGGYGLQSGTSMACPHVSGVAALIVSHFGGPGFTNEMLKEALLASSNKTLIPASDKIGGLVDAYGAFRYIDSKDVDSVEPVTDLEAAGRQNFIDLSWTVPQDSNGEAAFGFLILYGENKADVEAATADDHSKVSSLRFDPGATVGKKVKYSISKAKFDTKYYVKVLAYSFAGLKYSAASAVKEAVTEVNNAPAITTDYTGNYELKSSERLVIPVKVTDADGHNVDVTFTNGSTADSFRGTDGNYQITIVGTGADEGTYTATVTATDEYGLASTKEFTYKILGNRAPVKIKDIDNVLMTAKGKEFTLDMAEYVSDPDGDELKYEVTISDIKVLHMVPKSGRFIGTALGYGTTDVEIKAKDAKGEAAVFNFKVQVKDPANPLSVYPNPVTDFVNIATLDEAETHIKIVSQTGKTVYDETALVSGYSPAKIDMTSCAPGVYAVTVTFGGKEYKQNIVKL